MYFQFKCPECGSSLKIREDLAGKKRTCPYCKTSILIPERDAALRENSASSTLQSDAAGAQHGSPANIATPIRISMGDGEQADPSDVNLKVTCLIGFVGAILFFCLIYPIKFTYLGRLFLGGGFLGTLIQFISTFMFLWAVAILVLKYRKLKRQRSDMLLDVLPVEISEEISLENLNKFAEHIYNLPGEPQESYLITRVLRGLEHFRVRRSAAETVTMMSSQAEIDYNSVGSSYMALKVLIWAIPIMGFIGTVLGISLAVSSLSGALSDSEDMSALKDSLQSLFSGLGTAFDTTLVALLLSMMIKFPMSSLQKSEDGLLNWVDEYCNENLLRRLQDSRIETGPTTNTGNTTELGSFRKAIEEALAHQQSEMAAWHHKMADIGKTVSAHMANSWTEINQKWVEQQTQLGTQLLQQVQVSAAEFADQHRRQQGEIGERLDAMQNLSTRLEESFSGMERGVVSLGGVLDRLETVLNRLGAEAIVIQQVEPPRRSWFSLTNLKNLKKEPQPESSVMEYQDGSSIL